MAAKAGGVREVKPKPMAIAVNAIPEWGAENLVFIGTQLVGLAVELSEEQTLGCAQAFS